MRTHLPALLLALCWVLPGHAADKKPDFSGQKLSEVRFVGNAVTSLKLLEDQGCPVAGDPVDESAIAQCQQTLMNLGLFESVKTQLLPDPKGPILEIRVKEKIYILPLPTASRSPDGLFSYGGEFTWDNVAGLNQRLRFKVENKEEADNRTVTRTQFEYNVPRFVGTTWGMNLSIHQDSSKETVTSENDTQSGVYKYRSLGWSLGTSRWIREIRPNQGLQWSGGVNWGRTEYNYVSGTPGLAEDKTNITYSTGLTFTTVDDTGYSRQGGYYGINLGLGIQPLGSRYNSQTVNLQYIRYYPIGAYPAINWNSRFQLGAASGPDLKGTSYAIGGADSLRGYDKASIEGDWYMLYNTNLLIPINRFPEFRWALFADIGNAWRYGKTKLDELKYGVGVGARWRIRFLVNTDLRLDIAWAPGQKEVKYYAGSNTQF
ncbi:MAG: BamA/TamA family outer membrane protein [Gammaproteobacteria bacterium]|jgi:outer membrane protein assembly factor BamA